jgi:catechol 2,3-dioxygenase-like lactoylglutathione lyase family enzyme
MRLAQVILFSEDVPRLAGFYRDLLGLAELQGSASSGWLRLDAGGAVLALHALPAATPPTEQPAPRLDSYVKVCFHVDDIESTRAGLVSRGVRMREVHRHDGAAFCDGIDPDGNIFQITTR